MFERLQVPIVKIALIDYDILTRSDHPARKLLDSLAEASIGAAADTAYFPGVEAVATDVVNAVCRYPHLDVSVFVDAAAAVKQFIEDDYHRTASEFAPDVADALATEQHDLGRAQAQAMVRDHLRACPCRCRSGRSSSQSGSTTSPCSSNGPSTGPGRTRRHAPRSMISCGADGQGTAFGAAATRRDDSDARGRATTGMRSPRASARENECLLRRAFSLHISVLRAGTDDAISRAASAATEATLGRVAADTERVGRLTANKGIYDFVGEIDESDRGWRSWRVSEKWSAGFGG